MYKLQYTLYYGKVIRNNIAVCLLYLGRLKEGLQLLENSITADPTNIQVGCLTLPLSKQFCCEPTVSVSAQGGARDTGELNHS